MNRKQTQHEAIRERAREALRDLYHNATPSYCRDLFGRSEDYAQSWFEGSAEFEIEYLADGGAYGKNYRATLEAPCNAGRYKSERARAYYIAAGMRKMREDREQCAMWEYIGEFGKLYQYGRGGRTLAPSDLVSDRGNPREDYADKMAIAECVRLLRIVESFNRYVTSWCDSVPEMWREHCEEEDATELAEKRKRASAKGKETRERNYWHSRDVVTV